MSTMTRREWVQQIAYEWVSFDNDITARFGAEQKRQGLDRSFAFVHGRKYISSGRYQPRKNTLDYSLVAREARKHVPYLRNLIREFPES